jgi:beta-glucosidase
VGNAYWNLREARNEARAAQGPAPILFLGDSITDWFATGPGQPVWDTFLAPLGAENFAVAGVTTWQVLWQVESGQVATLAPDVVVLMIGTNNLALGQSPPAVAEGIAEIVDEITARSPRTKVLLLGILPRGRTAVEPLRAAIAQVNAAIASLDDGQRVRYLDVGSQFLQPDGTLPPTVMADGLHPTLWGYEILIASIWQPLLRLATGK